MGTGLKVVGTIVLIIGMLALIAGVGGDFTESANTCYETYTGATDCVSYQYQDTGAQATFLGIGGGSMLLGIILVGASGNGSTANSGVSNDLKAELEKRQEQR